MMRKIILLTFLSLATVALAQLPQWRIHPKYDSIKMLGTGYYVVNSGGRYGIMDQDEKLVVPMQYDSISPFNSGLALLCNNDRFVAYVNDQGRLNDVSDLQYKVVGLPRFAEGYLVVHNQQGYYYIRGVDNATAGPYSNGIPMSEGYAVVKAPKSLKHILDGDSYFRYLSAKTNELVRLSLGEDSEEDIDFASSVSNGKSIIVIKKRFYEYDFTKQELTPLSTDGDVNNKKSRVTANERPVLIYKTDEGHSIRFKQGVMTFDKQMRLTSITYTGQTAKQFTVQEPPVEEPQSQLSGVSYPNQKQLGIAYNGKEVLPAQFDSIHQLWDNEALVSQRGKYGVVSVDPQHFISFVLNDNNDIGFEHKTVTSNIKVVCPPYMKPSLMTLNSEDRDCTINVDTRRETANVETAVLSYDCTIRIPEDIDVERKNVYTKFSLAYDGLRFTPSSIGYNTWYINNYSVQILNHQAAGSVMTADILVRNSSNSSKKAYFEVGIEAADSVVATIEKSTEEMYTARFYGWKTDIVKFDIEITEDGCPTISYTRSISVKAPTNAAEAKKEEEEVKREAEKPASQGKVKHKTTHQRATPKKEERKLFIPN